MDTAELYTENKTLSLGFVGVGWIGRNRMEVLLQSGKATAAAIAEPSAENSAEAIKLAPTATKAETPEAILKSQELDGVVIATPSAMHASQSLEALNNGKAVFCQKPLGRTAQEVQQIVEASRKADKLLSVDLSYRYTKAFKSVYDVVASGQIGKIYAVDLVFHNAYGPDKAWFYEMDKAGGGCVMDLGIHMLDLALHSLGFPEVLSVKSSLFSKGEKLEPGEQKVEDFARVSIETETGTAISLDCSWHVSAGKDAVIQATFYGTEGGASFKNINGSFYDFVAEKYKGTHTEVIAEGTDAWSGRAGVAWAEDVIAGKGFDAQTAGEYLSVARVIDTIYGREA